MDLKYTKELSNKEDLYELYNTLEFSSLSNLNEFQLLRAINNSYYVLYAYNDDKLIAIGRIISDGVTNAYLCNIGVHPNYRNNHIGYTITNKLIEKCKNDNLKPYANCTENLIPFFEKLDFKKYNINLTI